MTKGIISHHAPKGALWKSNAVLLNINPALFQRIGFGIGVLWQQVWIQVLLQNNWVNQTLGLPRLHQRHQIGIRFHGMPLKLRPTCAKVWLCVCILMRCDEDQPVSVLRCHITHVENPCITDCKTAPFDEPFEKRPLLVLFHVSNIL